MNIHDAISVNTLVIQGEKEFEEALAPRRNDAALSYSEMFRIDYRYLRGRMRLEIQPFPKI